MFFIAPLRTSKRVMRTPILASCSPSSRRPCARSARNVVPNERPAKPDACSARYQYSGVGPLDPTWDSSRRLSGLARRPFHAPDLPHPVSQNVGGLTDMGNPSENLTEVLSIDHAGASSASLALDTTAGSILHRLAGYHLLAQSQLPSVAVIYIAAAAVTYVPLILAAWLNHRLTPT